MAAPSIPVIDLSLPTCRATLAAIDAACRDWGFFQVVNHGIDPARTVALQAAMAAFFGLAPATKQALTRTRDNPWGYYDRELTKNTPDWKEVYDIGPADGDRLAPRLPDGLPGFADTLAAWMADCETLAFTLLEAVSTNLGMPADHLAQNFVPAHTSFLRLNHYPRCETPATPDGLATTRDGYLGVNYHTDAGALTLLLQDTQPGLEVWHAERWYRVPPLDGALVVNIGDMVQVWSNDRYRAALHRAVVSRDAARMSAPYFFNPAWSTEYAPLPSLLAGGEPPRYRPIAWREFRERRADGDYADYGQEVQISDYALPAE